MKNKKLFLNFFLYFWNLVEIWNICKQKMTLIADVFPKLRTIKNMVGSMPEKSRSRPSFEKQVGKCAQTLFKFEGELLYHICWSLGKQLSDKMSLLVISKISKLFRNEQSADGNNFLLDRDKLT